MQKLLQRLNIVAVGLLGVVLSCVLLAQIRPVVHLADQAPVPDDKWGWPKVWLKTLQVYPSHPGDPVKLVKITKAGEEIVPGKYTLPEITGSALQEADALKDWLRDVSIVVVNESPKTVVALGLAVVLPARDPTVDCPSITGTKTTPNSWCDSHPSFCEGGCASLIQKPLLWGRIPDGVAAGMLARYRAERDIWRHLERAEATLQLAPGEVATLPVSGRSAGADGFGAVTDPRHPFSNVVNSIVYEEGIEEASGEPPCTERANSKTGCAFAEVPRFNVALDVVYFDDGTIWGNYGYGYATFNPDGVFTQVSGSLLTPGVKGARRPE